MQCSYVARQPVFDADLGLVGYELFYRTADTPDAQFHDPSSATTNVLGNLVVDFGFEALVDGRRAFLNVTREFFEDGHYEAVDPERFVLELAATPAGDAALLSALHRARIDGYTVALDGFTDADPAQRYLLDEVDMVKIDASGPSSTGLIAHAEWLRQRDLTLVAQRVETVDQFEACRLLGFDLFQGYFFAQPAVMTRSTLSPDRMVAARLLVELNRPDADARAIADVLRMDPGLTYRLLALINSSFYGLRSRVESIPQAVMLLGIGTIRNFASVLALSGLQAKPDELAVMALARARMCELVAQRMMRSEAPTAFTVGLLSMLDALLDLSLDEVVERLPVAERLREALLGRTGPLGDLLSQVEAYERDGAPVGDPRSRIPLDVLSTAYLDAVAWADQVRHALGPTTASRRAINPFRTPATLSRRS